MLTLAQAQALLPGSVLHGAPDLPFARVHTDTRSLRAGDLFVALRVSVSTATTSWPRHAPPAPWPRWPSAAWARMPGLQVGDTLAALQTLAAAWRARHTLPLIAVTGSNGKTTVTQMIAAMLRAWLGEDALATAGNLNNHIGVPMTLLRLRPHHRAAVVELGMNHPGEIALAGAPGRTHRGPGQQRPARAPGIHGQRVGRGAGERPGHPEPGPGRHRGVPGRRRLRAAVAAAGRPRARC
jgi:UDP-N-acetylmuramoyl-tripeptide--D-alanyl-D-alanine ligase